MSKIQTIKITNFKAIGEFEASFKGCTAIITAGNNKGKSSLLRGIPDRVRFIRPDVIVKQGSTKGSGEMTLTNGEKFVWEFDNEGKDKLVFISEKGIKQAVTKELGKAYFPETFDIDEFLHSTPKDQTKKLQKILGIDFTEIEQRYKSAYDDRTYLNKKYDEEKTRYNAITVAPEMVEPVDLSDLQGKKEAERDRLNKEYLQNKADNQELRTKWEASKREIDNSVRIHNEAETGKVQKYNDGNDAHSKLKGLGFTGSEVSKWLDTLKSEMLPFKEAATLYPKEPEYKEEKPKDDTLQALDKQIMTASETNVKAQAYTNYLSLKETLKAAHKAATDADAKVKAIEVEMQEIIKGAKIPEGIEFTDDGISVNGFPMNDNQISTSTKYIAALKLASMNLGEVKSLYFDASFLDRNSLSQIETWAAENDLQLLIERPDFEGGEIKYELIETQLN